MVSLGVGKRQTDEVSFETALISPFKAQSKMLKTPSTGFKRNSPNIIFVPYEKKYKRCCPLKWTVCFLRSQAGLSTRTGSHNVLNTTRRCWTFPLLSLRWVERKDHDRNCAGDVQCRKKDDFCNESREATRRVHVYGFLLLRRYRRWLLANQQRFLLT